VTLESTTYPMTSEDLLTRILESGSGLSADTDFAIAYSPEREDPGNVNFGTATIPKVVGADTKASGDMAEALYKAIVGRVVRVPSMRTAEAVKLTENIFRSVNIALVNELKIIFDKMGIDIFEVIDAAKTKPFGFMPFYPGPGIGGHCISIDPFYLTWKAREFGMHTRFIELAGEINSGMPEWVVTRLVDALSDKLAKPIRGAKLLIVGLAYKKNVDDMRESPSIILIEKLEARGAQVDYYDPYIPVVPKTREHADLTGRKSVTWDAETLSSFDAALIATDHDGVDLEFLARQVPLIVDSRGATRGLDPEILRSGMVVRA
jgi:UDP-N-acetyl-D-glucosamine dehydrogenase